jgi:hypothetical protein
MRSFLHSFIKFALKHDTGHCYEYVALDKHTRIYLLAVTSFSWTRLYLVSCAVKHTLWAVFQVEWSFIDDSGGVRNKSCRMILLALACLCSSVCHNSRMDERIFMKFHIEFVKICRHIPVTIKVGHNNGRFTWRPTSVLSAKYIGWGILRLSWLSWLPGGSTVTQTTSASLHKGHKSSSGERSKIIKLCEHFQTSFS